MRLGGKIPVQTNRSEPNDLCPMPMPTQGDQFGNYFKPPPCQSRTRLHKSCIMQENSNSPPEQSAQEQSATGTPGDATPSPIAELEKKLKEAEQKHVYLYAEFENFKKRALREQQETIKFGWKNVAANLLEVLDNFERALTFAKPEGDPDLVSGLKMVSQQFKSVLEKQGVTEIQTADQAFNPELHEAVGQIPSEKAAGIIVQEQQKGYTLHGRLLRPSRVLISTGPTNSVH